MVRIVYMPIPAGFIGKRAGHEALFRQNCVFFSNCYQIHFLQRQVWETVFKRIFTNLSQIC